MVNLLNYVLQSRDGLSFVREAIYEMNLQQEAKRVMIKFIKALLLELSIRCLKKFIFFTYINIYN